MTLNFRTQSSPAMTWKIGRVTNLRTTILATAATVAATAAAAAIAVAADRTECGWGNRHRRDGVVYVAAFCPHLRIIGALFVAIEFQPSTLASVSRNTHIFVVALTFLSSSNIRSFSVHQLIQFAANLLSPSNIFSCFIACWFCTSAALFCYPTVCRRVDCLSHSVVLGLCPTRTREVNMLT